MDDLYWFLLCVVCCSASAFLAASAAFASAAAKAKDHPRRPVKVLFLVRHGESTANENPEVYKTTPDHQIPLTASGREMARAAGLAIVKQLRKDFGTPEKLGHCRLWVSPFLRTRQTAEEILDVAGDWIASVRESPYLVEQDWGLFEGPGIAVAAERHPEEWARVQAIASHQGKFWARFPLGESCFDVCCRVASFFHVVERDYRREVDPVRCLIVVSHGVTLRAFKLMWLRRSPEWFGQSANPPNCSVSMIRGRQDAGFIFGGFCHRKCEVPLSELPVETGDDRCTWHNWKPLSEEERRMRDLQEVHRLKKHK
eukprot:NODE_2882_length_1098_cov_15.110582_g2643_i0.p1 GENE.NODE_2882_length_1098_cov_15.110582_g2643_i0~~NODE_2882_length_1098_cov_15.110582_g2643_i0.p1  ORF type:complete len:313 (+),score=43.10 NODE_2882_length_1098_cov_15.110582_g2643_i0:82-1020(+)